MNVYFRLFLNNESYLHCESWLYDEISNKYFYKILKHGTLVSHDA